ncbi:MAG: competence/damage-inducible protein A [Clostridiaceae bacterium]|nr:competence/damage-inducible protein A [Clostridiaceae bacterium]
MRVEIIAVGTELLLGEIANTDAQDISAGLAELGFSTLYHTVVGDNPDRLRDVLRRALDRADILITTGGLGPTYDDLTKEICAETFGLPLELHQPSLERILSRFRAMERPMTPNNEKQAMLPRGCTVFPNDWGTAPGCAIEQNGRHLLMLPGPPRECAPMFRHCAMPYLAALSGSAIHSDWIRLFGIGESAMEDRLRPLMESSVNPSLAPYAKEGECLVRVTSRAANDRAAAAQNAPYVKAVCDLLGDFVYGVNVTSLEQVVVRAFSAAHRTLACAESCTGGLLSKRITDIPGASSVFLGSAVTYANDAKVRLLGVSPATLAAHGAVSAETAVEMAAGVHSLFSADIGVAITGIAGPASDDTAKPVGLVYISVSSPSGVTTRELRFSGDRSRIRHAAASTALDMLRRLI